MGGRRDEGSVPMGETSQATPTDHAHGSVAHPKLGSEAARSRYLIAAAELAMAVTPGRQSVPYVAAKVRLSEVAVELGVTRTALYRRWETQEEFWNDLTRYLVVYADYQLDPTDLPWWQPTRVRSTFRFAESVDRSRRDANSAQHALAHDSNLFIRASLCAYGDLPDIPALSASVNQFRIAALGAQFDQTLAMYDCVFAPPQTGQRAAAATWCTGDGFGVASRFLPELDASEIMIDDGLGPKPWCLIGFAVRAMQMEGAQLRSAGAPRASATVPAPAAPSAQERWEPAQLEVLEAAHRMIVQRVLPGSGADHVTALGQITMASVARASRASRRAIYNVWESQDDLRLDLLSALLRNERLMLARRLERLRATSRGADHAAALAATLLHQPATCRVWQGHVRLAYLADANHPEVHRRNAAGLRAIIEVLADHLRETWPDRPSASVLNDRQFAAIVFCMGSGANRLVRVLDQSARTSLLASYAAGIEALVRHRPR